MVSVIIPVYNCEKTVAACLNSVMNQSYRDIEIIIIDDGSKDHTYQICTEVLGKDCRIKLIHQENGGVSSARNLGIATAKGEFIIFVDADDMLLPDAVEKLVATAETGVDMVIGSYEEFRGGFNRKVIRAERKFMLDECKFDMLNFDTIIGTPWAKLYKRQLIIDNEIQFDSSLPFGEDHVFNLYYIGIAGLISVVSDVVYQYRLGGIASSVKYYPNKAEINLALINAYREFFNGLQNIPKQFIKKKIRDQLMGCVEHYLVHCDPKLVLLKINDMFLVFSDFLTESYIDEECFSVEEIRSILNRDAKGLMIQVRRRKYMRIWLKRMKKAYYRYIMKRN